MPPPPSELESQDATMWLCVCVMHVVSTCCVCACVCVRASRCGNRVCQAVWIIDLIVLLPLSFEYDYIINLYE